MIKRLCSIAFSCCCLLTFLLSFITDNSLPQQGLLLDLDADYGITLNADNRVSAWQNQVSASAAQLFVSRDEGRDQPNSGMPTLRKNVKELNGHNTLVFRQQELVSLEEDVFDGLTTGSGFTWFALLLPYEQRVGLKDVNSFLGNLRNSDHYEGIWANLTDDNTFWSGGRNGITFGRFDENNPMIMGPQLQQDRYYLLAGRMGAGEGKQTIELFVNDPDSVSTGIFPVNPKANPSRMAIGQERDAIQHPGQESFDGEIARVLIYERPLTNAELTQVFALFKKKYGF